MIGRIALVALPLALAACSGGPPPDPNTPQGQCRIAARNDPQVIAFLHVNAAYADKMGYTERLNAVMHEAMLRCLQRRGLLPKGGVERVKSGYF